MTYSNKQNPPYRQQGQPNRNLFSQGLTSQLKQQISGALSNQNIQNQYPNQMRPQPHQTLPVLPKLLQQTQPADEVSLLNKYRSPQAQQTIHKDSTQRIVPTQTEGYQVKQYMQGPQNGSHSIQRPALVPSNTQMAYSRAQQMVRASQVLTQATNQPFLNATQNQKPRLVQNTDQGYDAKSGYGAKDFFNNYRMDQARLQCNQIGKPVDIIEISDVDDETSVELDDEEMHKALASESDSSLEIEEKDFVFKKPPSLQKFGTISNSAQNQNKGTFYSNLVNEGWQNNAKQIATPPVAALNRSISSQFALRNQLQTQNQYNQYSSSARTDFSLGKRTAIPENKTISVSSGKNSCQFIAEEKANNHNNFRDLCRKQSSLEKTSKPNVPFGTKDLQWDKLPPANSSKLEQAHKIQINQWGGYAQHYAQEASTRKILLQKKKEKIQKEIALKVDLEKRKRLLIEKKRRREAARADKELENLFADHGPGDDDEEGDTKELGGLAQLIKGSQTGKEGQIETKKTSKLSSYVPQNDSLDQVSRKQRQNNSNNVDELILPILSLGLVMDFHEGEESTNLKSQLPKIPDTFANHLEYRAIWTQLFVYETYCQLLSQKNYSDSALSELIGDRKDQKFNEKSKEFSCKVELISTDVNFAHLQIFEVNKDGDEFKPSNVQEFKDACRHIDCFKDHDLIVLSDTELTQCKGKSVKSYLNEKKLIEMAKNKQNGLFLCIVNSRRQHDTTCIKVKIDREVYTEYLQQHTAKGKHKMFAYFFDGLSTVVREFKTIKKSEFFPAINFIVDPQQDRKGFQSIQSPGVATPQMQKFLVEHSPVFNTSQQQALRQVAQMNTVDLLLIQGPPGTGKTHTIHGLIAMLSSCQARKILVCTPSNAAIDEIVLRLVCNGQYHADFSQIQEKVLRIGSMDYDPLPVVKTHTLDYKVEKQIEMRKRYVLEPGETLEEVEKKIKRLRQICRTLSDTRKAILKGETTKKLEKILKSVYDEKADQDQLASQFFEKFTSENERLRQLLQMQKVKTREVTRLQGGEHMTKKKQMEIQRKIIEKAQVICSTLSMSASDMLVDFVKKGEFDYLIVDEACQAVELTTLIPFMHEPNKVILVGDQKQLPATVFSENCHETGYSRSFFERMLACGIQKTMLNIQYRMHPQIRCFPSEEFYDGKLQDAESIMDRVQPQLLTDVTSGYHVEPTTFFDLRFTQESMNNTSKCNETEAKFIISMIALLAKKISSSTSEDKNLSEKIGIISPYKSQVRLIKQLLFKNSHKIKLDIKGIEVNTVDAFQGREKDFIIISTVRTEGMGFLRDTRRLNVAITRPRHFLWIVGNSNCLNQNQTWRALIQKGTRKKFVFYDKAHALDRDGETSTIMIEKALTKGKVGDQDSSMKKRDFKAKEKGNKKTPTVQHGLKALIEEKKSNHEANTQKNSPNLSKDREKIQQKVDSQVPLQHNEDLVKSSEKINKFQITSKSDSKPVFSLADLVEPSKIIVTEDKNKIQDPSDKKDTKISSLIQPNDDFLD